MIFTETELPGSYIIEPQKFEDERGFFARGWCQHEFEEHGLVACIVQANISYNCKRGTLRGMHYQVAPHSETKLIRCTRGALYDVIVDLRPASSTYRQWIGVELSEDNYKMLYVPEGFAHGFITLADNTEATYQVSAFYTPGAERGLRYDDPAFAIAWPLPVAVISKKDKNWSDFVTEEPQRIAG
jgi:dTDP-4-dehydrorhamnose 3,5-epimerase